jgi:hypothetical protein
VNLSIVIKTQEQEYQKLIPKINTRTVTARGGVWTKFQEFLISPPN